MADHQIRASDQDREDAAFVLAEAHAAGRLTRDELGQRLTAVYTASTWGELRALTADLPAGPRCPAYRQPSPGHGGPRAGGPDAAQPRLITRLSGIFMVAMVIGLAGLAIPAGMWLAALLIPAILLLSPAAGLHGRPALDRGSRARRPGRPE